MTVGETLAAGITALDLTLDAARQAQLLAYLTLLERWNRTHNLTAIRGPMQMVSHHLLDSLAILPHLPMRAALRMIDVGSGGGLPGVPIAIARHEWSVTLLESTRKKCAFLRQAIAELRLANVEVVVSRAEEYVPERPFDIVIARALAELPRFAAVARHLLGPRGWLVAMKAAYPNAELAQLPPGLHVVAVPKLTVPGVAGDRHLVIMEAATA